MEPLKLFDIMPGFDAGHPRRKEFTSEKDVNGRYRSAVTSCLR
jgi:hypothetical protein